MSSNSLHYGNIHDNPPYDLHMSNLLPSEISPFRSKRKPIKIFIIIGFLILTGWGVQILEILRGGETNLITGSLVNQLIYLSLYLVTFLLLILSRRKTQIGLFANIWFLILLGWTCLSIIWSGAPEVTIRNVIALCGTTLFSFYVANTLDIKEYITLLALSLFITNICSYLFIIFFPNIGLTPFLSEQWRGIFLHKNILARTADLSILLFYYLVLTNNKRKWIWLIGLLMSIGLTIGSHSATGIIMAILIILLMVILNFAIKTPKLILIIILALGIFILFSSNNLPDTRQLLSYFDKEDTLSGRTLIWDFSIYMGLKKPLLGYGYGAFWLGSEGPSAGISTQIKGVPGGIPMSAHNGFIEIFLEIGGVGLLIFLIVCWRAITRATKFLFKNMLIQNTFYFLILIFILSYNITENSLFVRNSIYWSIFSSTIFYLSKPNLFVI